MIQSFCQLAVGFLSICALYQTYVRLPQRLLYGSEPPSLPKFDQADVFIIFPGFGGVDGNTQRLEEEVKKSDQYYKQDRYVLTYDWKSWRGNTIRAAYDSEAIGKKIGRELCNTKLKNLHIVGVSVGAFAANACIQEYEQYKTAEKGQTRLTLLDPFTCKGLFGQGYGEKWFGKVGDYCEHFVNTDDPVPFTNNPLRHMHNFDVTNAQAKQSFIPLPGDNMHSWPVAYYGKFWATLIDPRRRVQLFTACHKVNPRGQCRKL